MIKPGGEILARLFCLLVLCARKKSLRTIICGWALRFVPGRFMIRFLEGRTNSKIK